jgi:hypothetical protein
MPVTSPVSGAHIREAAAPKKKILRVILESVSVIVSLGFGGCAIGTAGKLE